MQRFNANCFATMGCTVAGRARGARFVSPVHLFGFVALLGVVCASHPARADAPAHHDEVRLVGGEIIHGEVLTGDEKGFKMKETYGNEMTIPWEKVLSIETDHAVELRLLDGSRVKGKLAFGPRPATANIVGDDKKGPGTLGGIDLGRIASLNEPPEEADWSGRVAIGLTIQDGNTRSKTFFGSFDGERRSKRDRIEAHAYYAYGDNSGVLATKKGFVRAQYSYYVWNPIYLYVGGALEHDNFQDLRLRSRGGGGVGWAIVERKDLVARVEGGAEYVNNDFFGDQPDDTFVALRLAGHFEYQILPQVRLTEDVEVLPSAKQLRNFVSRSVSSANVAIWSGFGIAGIVIWQHAELPPDSLLRDDVTYILTLTYVF